MTAGYHVITIRCPVLAHSYCMDKNIDIKADVDVLLRLANDELTDIICPQYRSEGICDSSQNGMNMENCIYAVGWKKLENPEKT